MLIARLSNCKINSSKNTLRFIILLQLIVPSGLEDPSVQISEMLF